MSWLRRTFRWLRHWVPFTLHTVYYGSISVLLGPLTPDRSASRWAMREWSRWGLRFLRISVEVQGLEKIPSDGKACAYACNHQSLLDTLILGATLPGDLKWTVKSALMLVPFLGWHLWLSGHVRVDRSGGKKAAASAIRRFAGVLETGKPLLVFPEGTRSKDGQVHPFKMGLFYAAVRAGAPVVPVALHGTGAAMTKGATDIAWVRGSAEQSRRVFVRIGEPLTAKPGGARSERASDLRDRTQAAVLEMHRALVSTGQECP